MKTIKPLLCFLFVLYGTSLFAQGFYRPWSSYTPVKPQYSYKRIETLTPKLRESTCYYNGSYYEPNQIITDLDITDNNVFNFFKRCCQNHPSRCVTNYIGKNNQTLLYTMVEKKAYEYMKWILNEGFAYDSYIDDWGIYNEVNNLMIPVRNYNPMILACKTGDLTAAKILRERGAYLSLPENAIGLTPYAFAIKYKETSSAEFMRYIEKEYKEEIENINNKKQFGKYFDIGFINRLQYEIKRDFFEYQKKIFDKINELNKA